jgi:hypothetical protein
MVPPAGTAPAVSHSQSADQQPSLLFENWFKTVLHECAAWHAGAPIDCHKRVSAYFPAMVLLLSLVRASGRSTGCGALVAAFWVTWPCKEVSSTRKATCTAGKAGKTLHFLPTMRSIQRLHKMIQMAMALMLWLDLVI